MADLFFFVGTCGDFSLYYIHSLTRSFHFQAPLCSIKVALLTLSLFSPLPFVPLPPASPPFKEDLILAEERTSARDKKRIMEGKWSGRPENVAAVGNDVITSFFMPAARRKAAEGKKRKTEEEELAG